MFLDAIHSQLSTTPRNTGSNTRLARALRERLFPRSTERGPIEAGPDRCTFRLLLACLLSPIAC